MPTSPIQLPPKQEGLNRNYGYFPIVIDPEAFGEDRDAVFDRLAEGGIHARKYFYPLTSAFECYNGQYNPKSTPIALKISQRVMTLPIYADLAIEDVDYICELILKK